MKNLKRIINFLTCLFYRFAHVLEHLTCDEVSDAYWNDLKE